MRIVALIVLGSLCGCALSSGAKAPPHKGPDRIAVIEFGDNGAAALAACEAAIREAGYAVIEDDKVAAALPNDSDIDYHKIGKALGADMLLDGGIPRGGGLLVTSPARLISALSGNVLALSKSRAPIDRGAKVGEKTCHDLLKQLP